MLPGTSMRVAAPADGVAVTATARVLAIAALAIAAADNLSVARNRSSEVSGARETARHRLMLHASPDL